MSGSYATIAPISSSLNGFAQPISAVSFDPVSDILWAGLNSGVVAAYLGRQGVRGPCFHIGGNLSVKKMIAGDNHVHAADNGNELLGSWTKGGVNKWHFRIRTSSKLLTFSNTPLASTVLATSLMSLELAFLSTMTGAVIRQVQTSSLLTHLELSHTFLVSGSSDGYVRVHDPRTGAGRAGGAENFVKAHARSIQGLQTAGNYIFTIGIGERLSHPYPDPLVKVYDVRNMKALAPIAFPAGPAFIHTIPMLSSSLAIISNEGLINIVDTSNLSAATEFYQVDTSSYLTCSAISATGAYLAFGTSEGTIHLMSQAEENTPFNGFEGQPLPMADIPAPLPVIEWTESTPLNIIGMPYFDSKLLSAWPSALGSRSPGHSRPQRIPPQVLATMKYNEEVAYASLPKELRGHRNMTVSLGRKGGARFRSDKAVEPEPPSANTDHFDADIPRIYRRVEIEYSKFGVEDFDFGFYNKTEFSGLETHILNSYTNSVVQTMHYVSPIRGLAKAHVSTDCSREHCLLCELGFTSRMLEDARGVNCQASNFCKTVGVLAHEANAIEIVDYGREGVDVDYTQKIQAFHRFLIESLNTEINNYPHNPRIVKTTSHGPPPSPITQLLGIEGINSIQCSQCNSLKEKPYLTHTLDMLYPMKSIDQSPSSFADLLNYSLFRPDTHKAICQHCKHFSTFTSTRSIASRQLPPILAVNASTYNNETLGFWREMRGTPFMAPHISLHGQVNGMYDPEAISYQVRALILKIAGKGRKPHLVAIIKVPEAEQNGSSSPWYLFNDFFVKNITQNEALSFQENWKVPAIVYLERTDMYDTLNFEGLSYMLDPTILKRDTSISLNPDLSLVKHQILGENEMPRPGTLVAIDSEFVLMQQEETEFRSDGTKKVLRPARLSLARVSVLRGSGPREGVPFIDDHIHTSEMIVDYLTEYSGIKFGDLDPALSPYMLTPLKLVYKKLRYLVDCGCIFIGHGLSKDFRIINIYVPPERVIDTVDLYFLKARQRRLSLRFLSWYVLGVHIQTDTHDSVEDAHSALRLYKASQEFEERGIFDQKLDEIYREGKIVNFKPPMNTDLSVDRAETASPVPAWAFSQPSQRHTPMTGT